MLTSMGQARLALLAAAGIAVLAAGCHRNRQLINDNDELYQVAQRAIAERKYLEAIRLLGDVGLATPVSDQLDPLIKLALADAHFYQSGTINVVEAQSRYEQFLTFYPLHESARYARYQVGVCLLRQAEDPENDQEFSIRAVEHFRAMAVELSPSDPWRRAAAEKLVEAQEILAEHEWLVAGYYRDQGKARGAIGRLTRLIESYPGARRREEAFLELAEAHAAVGDVEQQRLTLQRMLAEYPGGSFAAAARQMMQELGDATGSAPGAVEIGNSQP